MHPSIYRFPYNLPNDLSIDQNTSLYTSIDISMHISYIIHHTSCMYIHKNTCTPRVQRYIQRYTEDIYKDIHKICTKIYTRYCINIYTKIHVNIYTDLYKDIQRHNCRCTCTEYTGVQDQPGVILVYVANNYYHSNSYCGTKNLDNIDSVTL